MKIFLFLFLWVFIGLLSTYLDLTRIGKLEFSDYFVIIGIGSVLGPTLFIFMIIGRIGDFLKEILK